MTKLQFVDQIKIIFPEASEIFFSKIEIYKTFLQEYNKKVNLTRLDTEDKIYSEYFYESVVPYKDIDFSKYINVLDIGSGSGIPGVVLKLLFPNIKLVIIEPNTKKNIFLNLLKERLQIDFFVINKRAELIKTNEYESFDLVTSRAVAPLPAIIEISLPYVKIGGFLIEPKGANIDGELNGVDKIVRKIGGEILSINHFISINNKNHNVVIIKKNAKTNHSYPRK
jgi:16S rRNA (guanine527-N7)-methyltransferase